MKLLHAADFHLDAPFAALSPEKAALRRAEGRELLSRLAALAREEQVDLVLLSGDLFDSQSVYPETLTALREALAAIPVPVFIAPGNHDFYFPKSPYAARSWPGNVTIFDRETFTQIDLPALGCTIYGFSFCQNRVELGHLGSLSVQNDTTITITVIINTITTIVITNIAITINITSTITDPLLLMPLCLIPSSSAS